MRHTYEYPRPALTVDGVVFSKGENGLRVLLVKRAHDPFKGCWAIPGGFVDMDEPADNAVRRELEEETGLQVECFKQFHTFTTVDRDPRDRVVSVAYWAFVTATKVHAGSDASLARWVDMDVLPALAFDHDEILSLALQEVRSGWISVLDETPELGVGVIALCEDGLIVPANMVASTGEPYWESDVDHPPKVTHWIPCPDRPLEGGVMA